MTSQDDVSPERNALTVVCGWRVNAHGNDVTLRDEKGRSVWVDTREVEGGGVRRGGGVEHLGRIRVAAAPP